MSSFYWCDMKLHIFVFYIISCIDNFYSPTLRLLGPVAANFENDYKRKEKVYERNERLKIPSWREDDGHLCW